MWQTIQPGSLRCRFGEGQADECVLPIPDTRFGDHLAEDSYTCDACGEEIVVPLDLSQGSSQEYVEDCPVCCRPNVIHVEIDEDGNASVWAELEQDGE